MEKDKEFSSVNVLDYKRYKEFAFGYGSTRRANIIFMVIAIILLLLSFLPPPLTLHNHYTSFLPICQELF